MAFIMISVAYGITNIMKSNDYPIAPYYILFIFSTGFVLFSVFFEKEIGAVYPRDLAGGALASICLTFIITAAVGGTQYIWKNGLSILGIDTLVYAFSISMILSLILLYTFRKIDIKIEFKEFLRVPAIVAGIAFAMMVSIVYGIKYILNINIFPIQPSFILLIFAIVFVIASVFYEKRGAIFPWSLLGSAIVSACIVFIITALIGGMRYIWENGFTVIGTDTVFYAFSICIVLSMVLFNVFNTLKDKL